MDTDALKKKLLAEKKNLESELGFIGEKDEDNPGNYDVIPAETDQIGFRDEIADRFEEFNERLATEQPLEARLKNIREALKRLEEGTYGTCVVCGEKIEDDRLTANPSARTCEKHLETDSNGGQQ